MLHRFEANAPLQFAQHGKRPQPTRPVYSTYLDLPGVGIATHGTGLFSPNYVVAFQGAKYILNTFKDNNDEQQWLLTNGDNQETVLLTVAGLWKTGTLLPGVMSTLHTTRPDAKTHDMVFGRTATGAFLFDRRLLAGRRGPGDAAKRGAADHCRAITAGIRFPSARQHALTEACWEPRSTPRRLKAQPTPIAMRAEDGGVHGRSATALGRGASSDRPLDAPSWPVTCFPPARDGTGQGTHEETSGREPLRDRHPHLSRGRPSWASLRSRSTPTRTSSRWHRFKADEGLSHRQGARRRADGARSTPTCRSRRSCASPARARADGIHPGYGFLSESPEFAEACKAAGIVFIGPSPETMRTLGNKVSARNLAVSVDVPVMPATNPLPDDEARDQEAGRSEIGFAGDAEGLVGRRRAAACGPIKTQPIYAARRGEIGQARGEVRLRKGRGVPGKSSSCTARHIEVQLLGDTHGTCVHLFERDCSIQRRNQKVVERAPADFLTAEKRKAICDAAIRIGEATNYVGAGTVEFLFDADTDEFYFIEVNPRIQVEARR